MSLGKHTANLGAGRDYTGFYTKLCQDQLQAADPIIGINLELLIHLDKKEKQIVLAKSANSKEIIENGTALSIRKTSLKEQETLFGLKKDYSEEEKTIKAIVSKRYELKHEIKLKNATLDPVGWDIGTVFVDSLCESLEIPELQQTMPADFVEQVYNQVALRLNFLKITIPTLKLTIKEKNWHNKPVKESLIENLKNENYIQQIAYLNPIR